MMQKMLWLTVLIGIVAAPGYGDARFPIVKRGKQIQRDGFMLEWNAAQGHRASPKYDIYWDALNTREGVSGYIRYARPESFKCASWIFRLYPKASDSHAFYEVVWDSACTDNPVFTQALEVVNGVPMVTIEWVVPWSLIQPTPEKRYELKITGENGCGETIDQVVLDGRILKSSGRSASPHSFTLYFSIVLVILSALYFNMRSRAKRFQ
jgi:hypothetical protein